MGATIAAYGTECNIEISVQTEGWGNEEEFALNAAQLSKAIGASKSDEVRFEDNDTRVKIICGRGRYDIPKHEFIEPAKDPEDKTVVKILESDLYSALQMATPVAPSGFEGRLAMGIRLAVDEKTLVDATDGRRLVRVEIDSQIVTGESVCGIMPSSSLRSLLGNLSPSDDNVTIEFYENSIVFLSSDFRFFCRQAEGRIPDFSDIFARCPENKCTIDPETFDSQVGEAAVFGDKDSKGVDIDFSENRIDIHQSTELGLSETSEEYEVGFEGGTCLDAQFLRDFTSRCSGEMDLYYGSDSEAVYLASKNATYVIMPLARN